MTPDERRQTHREIREALAAAARAFTQASRDADLTHIRAMLEAMHASTTAMRRALEAASALYDTDDGTTEEH